MLAGRPWSEWIQRYGQSHQHPINQACHRIGIPLIVLSLGLSLLGFAWPALWWAALGLFGLGWLLQFAGHAVEGKPPEFFSDPRFLLVGVRWWLSTVAPGSAPPHEGAPRFADSDQASASEQHPRATTQNSSANPSA